MSENQLCETPEYAPSLNLSKEEIREFIAKVEKAMEQGQQIDVPTNHHFSKGVYAREMVVPKGVMLVGKIHKFQNLNILSKGEVTVLSIDGSMRVKAPFTFVGSPGSKRLFYMHEETVWTTIHGTDETDIDKIESEFIAKDYEELYLSTNKTIEDVLNILGFTSEELTCISENEMDQVPFSSEITSVSVCDSPIHGNGLFANVEFKQGQTIAPARINHLRTPAGRYANHSPNPNAEMVMHKNGDVDLIAIRDIEKDSEILTDYFFNYTKTRGPVCLG